MESTTTLEIEMANLSSAHEMGILVAYEKGSEGPFRTSEKEGRGSGGFGGGAVDK